MTDTLVTHHGKLNSCQVVATDVARRTYGAFVIPVRSIVAISPSLEKITYHGVSVEYSGSIASDTFTVGRIQSHDTAVTMQRRLSYMPPVGDSSRPPI